MCETLAGSWPTENALSRRRMDPSGAGAGVRGGRPGRALWRVHGRQLHIEFTRSRPFRKNDQAWVEQKNGAVVRRLVGYGRLEGVAAGEALARLYSASRLFVNVFQPSFKLAEKTRIGARVHKRYHPPETPCARLLASDAIPAEMKDRLRALPRTLDPLGS